MYERMCYVSSECNFINWRIKKENNREGSFFVKTGLIKVKKRIKLSSTWLG